MERADPGPHRSPDRAATARGRRGLMLALTGCLQGLPVLAQDSAPMSAIDWLSRSVLTPAAAPRIQGGYVAALPPPEPPVSSGAAIDPVLVTPLDRAGLNGLGLLPAARTGLPRDLWGLTPEPVLAQKLTLDRVETLPAIQAFLLMLLVAEFDPPRIPDPEARDLLFLARIDRLLALGALEPALAMLDLAGARSPEVFRRRFDVELLLGHEDRACAIMGTAAGIAPSFPARIFCLARRGDWNAAALSLGTGRSLGHIDAEMSALLERFLDPELAEEEGDLPPPAHPSPLVFRMMEAIGQPMPTTSLPVAFSQADLRANTGWKARIEAGERLARMGVLDPNQLLGLYTERQAAASGGVWARVAAVARLDQAVAAGDADAVTAALPAAHAAMAAQGLTPVLSALYARPLASLELEGAAGALAFRLGLLSEDYETLSRMRAPADPAEAFLIALAEGRTAQMDAADALGQTLKEVFDAPVTAAPDPYRAILPDRLGEALLAAIDDITEGARGDYRRLGAGLRMLRFAGLETLARRSALELMVLGARG